MNLLKFWRYFDEIDRNEFFVINLAFLIVIIPGYIIGFTKSGMGIVYTAIVISCVWIIWNILYFIGNYIYDKKEAEILKELPSFPQKDFCDVCGKSLENAVRRPEGDLLIITCPHCGGENSLKKEKMKAINED